MPLSKNPYLWIRVFSFRCLGHNGMRFYTNYSKKGVGYVQNESKGYGQVRIEQVFAFDRGIIFFGLVF